MGQKLHRFDAQQMVNGAIIKSVAEYEPTDSAYLGRALQQGGVNEATQALMNFCFDAAAEGKKPEDFNAHELDRLRKAVVSEYVKAVKEQGQPINGTLATGVVRDEIEKPITAATQGLLGTFH